MKINRINYPPYSSKLATLTVPKYRWFLGTEIAKSARVNAVV